MQHPVVKDQLVTPTDAMTIRSNVRLKPGVYALPNGISIAADGVTLDGAGVTLIGHDRAGAGLRIDGCKNVTVKNLAIREYRHGIHASACQRLQLEQNQITSTGEVQANTVFLDIWPDVNECYGGAILLDRVTDSVITGNDIQHQMCGLLSYHCRDLTVTGNNASYNSGFGFHLYDTCNSTFENNWADYCCRYEPRGERIGHMGADATGFVIIHASCHNIFRGNFVRMGGDGFFLAGWPPKGPHVPCDDNLFESNDASLSPNIAFEATFSARNIFRNNKADRCNYGFWLGFSRDNLIENNSILWNRQAGVAVENGPGFTVRGNDFQRNGHGVLLWSKFDKKCCDRFPELRTCHHWTIEENTFTRNDKAICIAADKDHGIRPMPPDTCGKPEARPNEIAITGNDIQDNRVGVELHQTDRIVIADNTINRNVECNIRREDDHDTTIERNLGAGGGYL
ncbi:MAG: right-handed parallel beta-helix repeat-containing protein [Planctomycetes bacterium]|nr:right-handed parallel beta-helix repeat-containing protein [Planctomycetota bacterium]